MTANHWPLNPTWLAAPIWHAIVETVLGSDEFGRNQLVALLEAVAHSLVRAAYMAVLLFVVAGALAIFVELRAGRLARLGVLIVIDALESVPIYLWVLAGVSWASQYRVAVTSAIFVIAGLPLLYGTLNGVVAEIMKRPFYQAAVALGARDLHLVRHHILPNILPHAPPLIFYVTGIALAVYGVSGVFGFISRNALDLGVFLLRGKEQAGFDGTVLALSMLAYLLVFLVLQIAIRRTTKWLLNPSATALSTTI